MVSKKKGKETQVSKLYPIISGMALNMGKILFDEEK